MAEQFTRRAALGLVAGGAALTASETLGFSQITAGRGVNITTADDPDALVGLMVNDTVKANVQRQLVEVTNNVGKQIDVSVSLNDCGDGELFGPNGSGCTVNLSLGDGMSETIDIKADVRDQTIPFTVTATAADFNFEGTRETYAQAQNTSGAIRFTQLQNFTADNTEDVWTIGNVTLEDDDGDDDLDRVEYRVKDSDGNVRSTRTDHCGCNNGAKYQRTGNPAVTLQPDDSTYTVPEGETYTLRVTAYDADGNSAFETRTDTADEQPTGGGSA